MSAFAKKINEVKVEKKSGPKKNTSPVVDNAPADVKKAVDEVVDAKAQIKKYEAILKKASAVVVNHVSPIQDSDGHNGDHSKSYQVEGNENTVKYVTQDRFTVKAADEENIKEVLTEEEFDERFEKDENLTVNKEIFSDEEKQEKLIELMGEHFNEFFEYTATLKTKKEYDRKQFKLSEEKLNDLRVFVKQYSAALR
jgi:hypothetical protein